MNGEIPSVPITTLAGVASLTDLLPELPLPSPLPATLGNKSLLYNPRVSEEARRILSTPDENLVPQLLHALGQTSTDHIELKDKSIGDDIEGDVPALLQAILAQNPNAFKQKSQMERIGGVSPRQPMQPSPYYQQSPDAMVQHSPYQRGHTPMQGSPSAGFPQGSPSRFPQGSPVPKFTQSSPQRFPQSPNKFQQYPFPQQQNLSQGSPAPAPQTSINGFPGSQYSPATAPSPAVPAVSPGVMSPPHPRTRPPHSPGAAVSASSPGSSGKPFQRQKQHLQQLPPPHQHKQPPPPHPPPLHQKKEQETSLSCQVSRQHQSKLEREKNSEIDHKQNNVAILEQSATVDQSCENDVNLISPLKRTERNKSNEQSLNLDFREKTPTGQRRKSSSSVKSGPVVLLQPLTEAEKALARKSATAFQCKTPTSLPKPMVRLERLDLSAFSGGKDSPARERLTLKLSKRKSGRPRKQPDEILPELNLDEPMTPSPQLVRGKKRPRYSEMSSSSSESSSSAAEVESIESDDSDGSSVEDHRRRRKKSGKSRRIMDDEEMMESSTFKRFTNAMESVFEQSEEMDLTVDMDDEANCSPDLLISKGLLYELSSQAAKLKSMEVMNKIAPDKLVRLLNILERNIRDGSKLQPTMNQVDEGKHEQKLWRELTMDRVMRSLDAGLTSMYIMTADNMPKEVYLEDVIERLASLVKFQLLNTIYPEYDPVYRMSSTDRDGCMSNMKMKRARAHGTKEKSVIAMYNKLCELVSNFGDLLEVQTLTDTTVLQISSIGLAPFFVENVSELQLSAMKLITGVFSNYEKHRQLILEDIFASLARLPSSKKNLRNFRLNADQNIQMVTALVLQLIQCIVTLPCDEENEPRDDDDEDSEDERKDDVDKDVSILSHYESALRVSQNFLSVFLKKCTNKDEEDYRPLFENFVQDLLSTVNKPEWPAAEVFLSLLGRLLVHHFSNRSNDMTLRVSSLDYLGLVASRLRRDAVTSQLDQHTIDSIVKGGKESDSDSSSDESSESSDSSADHVQCLQRAMLNYLAYHGQNEPALLFARQFYIAQWFRDTSTEVEKTIKAQETMEDTTEVLQSMEKRKLFLIDMIKINSRPFASIRQSNNKLTYENASLVARYLTANRPFSQSFDIYLSQILRVLSEQAVAVRTKAVRCLTQVVEADPSMLARPDMERGVHGRFMDHSTSVREAAVELVGKFVLMRPELIPQYYNMLLERILDTGISVRKRVIKILRDICIEHPDFPKVPEMCVRMIRRVNDEEGIKKLVNETFQKMWFTPLLASDSTGLLRRVHHITDVVTACKESGYEWFEQLLCNSLMLQNGKAGPERDPARKLMRVESSVQSRTVYRACVQIVDCLVENVLRLEEKAAEMSAEGKNTSSHRLVSCMQTLFLFAKIKPILLVDHATTLQPYLTTKCSTTGDYLVLFNVAKTLELVVPLMDHPSEIFLATLEEDLMKLIIKHGQMVLQSCVSCLASVVNNVTHNYKLVKDCFQKFFGVLSKIKNELTQNPASTALITNKPPLLRSLFTVGLFCRHFNFEKDIKASSKVSVKDRVFEVLLFFVSKSDEEIKVKAFQGIGFFLVTFADIMLGSKMKQLYNDVLDDPDSPVKLKAQVLRNLTLYLTDEEEKMRQADVEWKKIRQNEDLKELGDIHSGMSSSVMQVYLKQVMESFFHTDSTVRMCALQVIHLVLRQGLVHPVQCIPYLVAMCTDYREPTICIKAEQQLSDIDSKYPGFIHMKALAGIRMSYRLQQLINGDTLEPLRGTNFDEHTSSLCSHLYTLIRSNRLHRRALLLNLLNLFDEQSKNQLGLLVYVADNLAYFPYNVHDEPLFIMHYIEIIVSVSGANLLQSFKECLFRSKSVQQNAQQNGSRPPSRTSNGAKSPEPEPEPQPEQEPEPEPETEREQEPMPLPENENDIKNENENVGENEVVPQPDAEPVLVPVLLDDEDEVDIDLLMQRIPENPKALLDCCAASQACMVLLVLKQHLKDTFGFRDSTIHRYSPTEAAKVYDKALNRKHGLTFNPERALQFLRQGVPQVPLSDEAKKDIVSEYLDFKALMEMLDPAEDEEETGRASPKIAEATNARTPQPTTGSACGTASPGGADQPNATDNKDENNTGKQETTTVDLAAPIQSLVTNIGLDRTPYPYNLQVTKHPKRSKPKPKPKPKKPRHRKRKRFSLDVSDGDSGSSDPDFIV
uniref:Nipped-B protein n=1 Tax=Saccoglossus kowalevskii TaxID=10224 RepID=A0ABM0MHK9_SACKO|nr:PREDICTED: nipped-B-like protein-like isoform X1 [Saccoglossus kowalevskii]